MQPPLLYQMLLVPVPSPQLLAPVADQPPQVTASLDRLVEPLQATLQAKVKADAGERRN